MKFLKPSLIEQLSAYLDGKLTPRQRADIEKQLAANPQLRADLESLHRTRIVLRATPRLRAPRNFTITPQMVRTRPQIPIFYPYLRWSTALSGLLVLLILLNNHLITPLTVASTIAENAPVLPESSVDNSAPLRLPTDEIPPTDLLLGPEGIGAGGGGGGAAPDELAGPQMFTAAVSITFSEPISQPFAITVLPLEDTAPSAKIANAEAPSTTLTEANLPQQNSQDWLLLEIALVCLAIFQALLLWYYRWRSSGR